MQMFTIISSCEKYTKYQFESRYCLFDKLNIHLTDVYEKKLLQINVNNGNSNA